MRRGLAAIVACLCILSWAAVFVALAAGRTTTDGAGLVAAAAVAAAAVVIAGGVSLRVLGPAAAGVAMAGAGVVALRSAVNSSQLPLDAIQAARAALSGRAAN